MHILTFETHLCQAGLTFGKTISGILAHSKGKSIGIYEDRGKTDEEIKEKEEKEDTMGVERIVVFGMKVSALNTLPLAVQDN